MDIAIAQQFLRENENAVLATWRRDGRVQMSPVTVGLDGAGAPSSRAPKPPTRPRPSEGQFFGQVRGAHFTLRCDATKWGAFRPDCCRQAGPSDTFLAPFGRSAQCCGYV